MASFTKFLGLLKKDPVADAADTFNVQTMLNENWDKIDAFCSGAAQIAVGSYVGTGDGANAGPYVELSFDFSVKFLVVSDGSYTGVFMPQVGVGQIHPSRSSIYEKIPVSAEENTVTFQGWVGSGAASWPLCTSGETYNYIAFGLGG